MAGKGLYRYPGTRPFEDNDSDRKLFFGRDREKEELLQRIIAGKLVVVHAESGLGKTSLLNAGVSALLRDRGYWPIKIRFNLAGISPVQAVFSAITETAAQQCLDLEPGETETLWHYFKTAASWSPVDTLLTPVLIFDQFEEFFAFHEPEARGEFTRQLADLVHNTLPGALRQAIRDGQPFRYGEEPPRVKMVISIRGDFLWQLDELSSAIPEILDNRFRLLALTRKQARAAITGPAQIQDEQIFTPRFRYSEDAVNTMLDYLSRRREKGGVVSKDEVESFQLQLLCRHIETEILENAGKDGGQEEWEIKKEDLGGEAGLHKVFQYFYEDRLAGLKSIRQKRRVRRLCEKGLISASDRRLSLEEEVIGMQYKVSPALLAQLVDSRLLRAEKRVGSVYYELSHDTLIAPIRLSQRKRRATLEKYALLLLAPVFIAVMILLTIGGESKQNKLNTLFKEAEQLSFNAKNDRAIEKYNQILEMGPKNVMAIVKLGELLREDGKYETAVQLYKKAIDDGITDARVYTGLGKLLFKIGKEEEAINYLNEAIKRNPGQTEAYEILGDYSADKKEFKDAIENYEKVLAINIKSKGIYEKLAVFYVETGEKEKAIEVFKRAITVDAEYVGIYQEIRDVLKQTNESETLETLYGIALNVKIKNVYHYYWLGNDYYDLKKYDAAIASYQKALELRPDYAVAYNNMGIAYRKKGNYNGAIASYRKAIELKPDNAETYYNMGVAQDKKGDYDGALASYRKALELKPDDANPYYHMGVTQKNKGEFDAAISSFQKALAIKPSYLSPKMNLSELYLTTERFDKALELARQVLKEKDVSQDSILKMKLIVISSLFLQSNQRTQALTELQELITAYRNMGNDYKNEYDYIPTKKFITGTPRLSENTRALLLKLIALLEAPRKEAEPILSELEKW